MASYFLKDSKLLWDGYDFSANWREMSFVLKRDALEDTSFGDAAHSVVGGLQSFHLAASGFANPGTATNEGIVNSHWGTAGKVFTVMPEDSDESDIAYSSKAVIIDYGVGGVIGEMAPLSIAAYASSTTVFRGTVMGTGAQVASGNGTAVQLGAVGATEYLYASLHCTAVSGTNTPTITVKVYSDSAANMAGKTECIAFSAITAVGAQFATPIDNSTPGADDYFRVDWTVTGTDPSLTIYCTVGIQ